ncbi:DapH/DapD/GlmU-related protein [Pseudacidovorax sp.]|uniref:acyltransferase n=1 Tax=Pseudacidovorax sp. TaxID=1934311 RepID=UPI0025CB7F25|nr:acyltransferase [Pseudacidovorax sp.]
MFERFFIYMIFKIRNKKIQLDSRINLAEVIFHALKKGGLPFVRGLWLKLFIRTSKGLLFVGKSVTILAPSRLCTGRNFYVGSFSYLDCLCADGVEIGDNVTLREGAWMQISSGYSNLGSGVKIGNGNYFGPRSIIGAAAPIMIGDNNQFGANLNLIAENHKFEPGAGIHEQGVDRLGIRIGNGCWFGNNVTVLDGVVIGSGVVIGAGSLVTKSIPDFAVAYGVPAKVVRFRSKP